MRCSQCGRIISRGRCPCGAAEGWATVPTGTLVLARAGRGPSMNRRDPGEVTAHEGPIHQVSVTGRHRFRCAVAEAEAPAAGVSVTARRWNGAYEPAAVEEKRGALYRVSFISDARSAELSGDELYTFPLNPFAEVP